LNIIEPKFIEHGFVKSENLMEIEANRIRNLFIKREFITKQTLEYI